nr:hypothetical protein [Tanacetum cinerariifolium]
MNMLNSKCRTSFTKPEFLKKAQRANPRLYDIGCYNDNLALMLAPESDEVICPEKESRSKLSDLIRPFDYDKLNNLYDLFVPQREKSSEQRYFLERSKPSHTPINNGNSKKSFNKQTTLLEKWMDESIPWDQKYKSSKELFKIKRSVCMIFDGVERCKETIAKQTYFGHIDHFIQNTIEANVCPEIQKISTDLEKFHVFLKEEMVADLRYFNSLELEGDSLRSQLETQKTLFFNEIGRLSSEYYYADHMNAILEIKKKLCAHQETISILSQAKEAQIKLYKTHEDKELDKVIALEKKVKVLDIIVYKTCQLVQTMNMLNRNCKTSFAKPEFLKKSQRANPRLYDICCYNDNLALMLAPESDEVIRLEKEKEMVAGLRYFNSLELVVDSLKSQLETQKTHFLNEIDRLSKEYYYADHMNAILGMYTELDEVTNLQLSGKDKNDKSFKENQSKEFRKEREQYFEIQDLKAQLQDKGIAISELKKLIEKLKGKSVDTKFEKSSVIRQPNAFKSQRPSILGKPTIFSDSLKRKDFSKSKSVTKNNVSNDFLKPVTT